MVSKEKKRFRSDVRWKFFREGSEAPALLPRAVYQVGWAVGSPSWRGQPAQGRGWHRVSFKQSDCFAMHETDI